MPEQCYQLLTQCFFGIKELRNTQRNYGTNGMKSKAFLSISSGNKINNSDDSGRKKF